ncbi:VOC family protein [Rhodohalobacter mucosus]|nr:VOC family protein [Rhodohalobacter mucosus]
MKNNEISYIEFKAHDLEQIKTFYHSLFGWTFTNYGPTYISFSDSGVYGGFEKTEDPILNGVLVVLYHADLESIKADIENAGGTISKDIFSFPGGRRFHFMDPSGNELAVWSDN